MRGFLHLAIGLPVAMLFAGPAAAQGVRGYAYCAVGSHEAVSPIFEIDYTWWSANQANRDALSAEWKAAASRVFVVEDYMGASCRAFDTRESAESHLGTKMRWFGGDRNIPFVPTVGGGRSGGASAPVATGAALTVKTDTGLRDAGRAWDEQVREALRKEAQTKAALALSTARLKAENEAALQRFLEAQKKRGRGQ